MSTQHPVSTPLVNKERVTCENCRFHYSYLYDAKQLPPDESPRSFRSEASRLRYETTLRRSLYRRVSDAWHPCPNCKCVQSWMVSLRRGTRLCTYGLVVLGLGLIAGAVTLAMSLPAGSLFAEPLAIGAAGVAALSLLYLPWLFWVWDPNRHVDCNSYEAMPLEQADPSVREQVARQYEQLARERAQARIAGRTFGLPQSAGYRVALAVLFLVGLAAFLTPAVFPAIIFFLSDRGILMAPFYLGAAFIGVSLLGVSWDLVGRVKMRRAT